MSARSRKKRTRVARSSYVQNFSAEDLKEYFLHRQNFYDSDEDKGCSGEDSDQSSYCGYDDDEYFGDHGEV